jgi:hypothetical protein
MLMLLRSTVKVKFVATFGGMLVYFVVNMWAISLFHKVREVEYVWKDWKERGD